MSFEGFHFTFTEDDAKGSLSSNFITPSKVIESDSMISVSQFPIYKLFPNLLNEWSELYPKNPQNRMILSSEVTKNNFQPLFYQRAPHVTKFTVGENKEQRDIIPGKYYGGLKVWSCAPYLVEYMFENRVFFTNLFKVSELNNNEVSSEYCNNNILDNPIVAEVGCGQGLPGIAAIILGARQVIFQDYNEEVLQLCVKPNIGVNILNYLKDLKLLNNFKEYPPIVRMVSGDWSSFKWEENNTKSLKMEKQSEIRCKVVLGTDVTFDEEACEKLAEMLSRCLCPINGVAYIASKEYYFGTNGGVLEFQRRAKNYGLEVLEVSRMDSVGEMKRLIMQVKYSR